MAVSSYICIGVFSTNAQPFTTNAFKAIEMADHIASLNSSLDKVLSRAEGSYADAAGMPTDELLPDIWHFDPATG